MPIKLSIVVPVYNKQDTINKTIDTIIPQLNNESEVVFVDDGSSDNSLNILSKLKKDNTDKNIKLIHKNNEGLISARETGIKKASGEFICNVDGGDGLADDSINTIIRNIDENKDVDYFVIDAKCIDKNGEHLLHYDEKYICDVRYLLLGKCVYSICFKIARRSLLINSDVFNSCKDITNGEDLCFSFDLMNKTSKGKKINSYLYIYNLDENSMTRNKKEPRILKAIRYVGLRIKKENLNLKEEYDYLAFKESIMEILVSKSKDNYKTLYNFYLQSNIAKHNKYIKYQSLCILLAKIKVKIYG